jgi:integration host factor subunit alpha
MVGAGVEIDRNLLGKSLNLTNFPAGDNLAKSREGVMAGHTVTRAQLTEAVYQEVGLSRNESAELVESVIAEISQALERGEMVKISSFGSFAVRQKGQRVGRNPKTGQEVPISPRRVLVFRASQALKHLIDDGHSRDASAADVNAAAVDRSETAKAASA